MTVGMIIKMIMVKIIHIGGGEWEASRKINRDERLVLFVAQLGAIRNYFRLSA
jgi:hypothetical protein